MIREATATDAPRLAEIYNYYIERSIATFEEVPLTEEEMALRIERVTRTYPWIIAERDGEILGYAYASPFKGRSAYNRTAETSIYLDREATARGVGSRLYRTLLDRLGIMGFHSAIGVLAVPNPPSEALHEKMGFKKVGVLRDAGYKFGAYIDVAYYQAMLSP